MPKVEVIPLFKQLFAAWVEDKVPRLAAALAFYMAFALAPLLLIAIAVAGLVFGREAATQQIDQQVSGLLGPAAGSAINAMVAAASAEQGTGIIASIIGLLTLLLAASGVFGELQDSLNTIWGVKPKPGLGIWSTIRQRFFTFGMVVGVGFLLLVSLVLSAALAAIGNFVAGEQFGETLFWQVVNVVVSFGVTTLLFALVFKVIPDATVQWDDVWIGALATAFLFTVGKALLGWYLGQPGTTSAYGAAGSFVALLLWIYYSAQILFLGAEFTQVYAQATGSQIAPSANAVAIIPPQQVSLQKEPGMPQQPTKATRGGVIAGILVGMLLGRRRPTPGKEKPGNRTP